MPLLALLLLPSLALAGDHDAGHAGHHGADHAAGHHDGADDATVRHRFDDVERWVKAFDDPARDAWQKPVELIAAMQLAPGSTVADIGAGTGYFNRHLAAAVGPDGKVVAIDVEANLVNHMARRAQGEKTANVEARLGEYHDPGLKPGEADVVLLVDTYHHIDDRIAYFRHLREGVAPGGRLVVVDFKAGEIPVGPPEDHRIAKDKVIAELGEAGWHAPTELDVLPHQFVVVVQRDPAE